MFPVLVASFVGWIRPDSAIGAVFSLAASLRLQFNFTSLYLTFLSLVTWLKALGTSRKKKDSPDHTFGFPGTSVEWPRMALQQKILGPSL